MQLVEACLSEADLESSVESVRARARTLLRSPEQPGFDNSLRRSVGRFVRRELHRAVTLQDNWAYWQDLLPADVMSATRTDFETLVLYAHRCVSAWRRALVELLTRLATDWPELTARFGLACNAALDAISAPLGDPHCHGRSVYAVRFSDGRAVVYKPRSVDAEDVFERLLVWLRDHGCFTDLLTYRVLRREGYGWTEFVPTTLCRTEEEVLVYHRRQGAYLALFWRLCGSDLVADNIVVAGPHPMWIDTECLFRPACPSPSHDTSQYPGWMRESVLQTGMVPTGTGVTGRRRARNGLSIRCASDDVSVLSEKGSLRKLCIRQVVRGFEDTYCWILSRQSAWSPVRAPLVWCNGIRVRVILRGTEIYDTLLRVLAITPAAHRSQTCDSLREVLRYGRGHGDGRFPDAVADADLDALLRGDVPYWSAATNGHDIAEAGGTIVPLFLTLTSMEHLERRGGAMSESDLLKQSWLLESFLNGSDQPA